jgi:hypothetical protein
VRLGKSKAGLLAGLAVLLAGLAVSEPSIPAASAAVATTVAQADAFVLKSNPTLNKGTATSLRARNVAKVSYMRFNVPPVPDGEVVSSAILQVAATTGSQCMLGVDVLRAASNSWSETAITWANQPGTTGPVLDVETRSSAGLQLFDVSAAVTAGGPVSFVLKHLPAAKPRPTQRSAAGNQVSIPLSSWWTQAPSLPPHARTAWTTTPTDSPIIQPILAAQM